jgi:hypothetical protein
MSYFVLSNNICHFSAKSAPRFDRSFLIDLAGAAVFRQAEKLFESHFVESAEWESPSSKGSSRGATVSISQS